MSEPKIYEYTDDYKRHLQQTLPKITYAGRQFDGVHVNVTPPANPSKLPWRKRALVWLFNHI